MALAGDLDWTDLMAGKVGEPEHPLSKALGDEAPNKGGENVTQEDLLKEAQYIVDGWNAPGVRSPSKDEFEAKIATDFPSLSRTEEEYQKAEDDWNNRPNDTFDKLKKAKVQEEEDDLSEWGNCKSFNDTITREQQLERNMHVADR